MPNRRTSSSIELHLQIDPASGAALHRQLERAIREAVRDGRLGTATTLPSSRALAGQLGVSRGVVVEAYEQLIAEGYLVSRPGGATRVGHAAAAPRGLPDDPPPARPLFDFRPGRPDLDAFPRQVWGRSIRRVLDRVPSDRLGYLDGRGAPELRTALAGYLNRARGTVAGPGDIVVCSGFAQGLALVARVLHETGVRTMAVEDPSDPEYRATIRAAGLEVVGIPVDESGIRVDLLDDGPARAVLVTAAHQYPIGAVLPAERRAALLAWAERRDGIVVEDDYDAEFRYDRQPIGTLQGLDPDRVAYAGSASKILAPGLRLGWLVAPRRLGGPLAGAKIAADMGSAVLDQLAFADVLERGELDHHLRRMRPVYRRRRDLLLEALGRHLPRLRPVGVSAGLHLLAWLPGDLDEVAIVEAATAAGIGISGLATRRMAAGPGGLVFGYGGIVEGAIDPGVRRLAEIIDGLPAPGTRSV
jgi:GntR family transcriptional regulator/MocR family aminotransferase